MKELQTAFEYHTLEAAERVRQRMLAHDQMLQGVRGLFTASANVDRQEFQEYCAALNLAERYKGIQALSYLPWGALSR